MNLMGKCVVCRNAKVDYQTRHESQMIDCPVCGRYRISPELLTNGLNDKDVPGDMRHMLSAWIKWGGLRGVEPPEVTYEFCKAVIADAPRLTPMERMDQLLLSLAMRLPVPGKSIPMKPEYDYPFSWAAQAIECNAYFGWLVEAAYVKIGGGSVALTRKGWERAAELQKELQHSGRQVFVAMWFDDSFDQVWKEGLSLGIRDAGYEPYRIKEDIHNEKIDFRIVAAIRSCRFLVAEVSEPRTAVYYEAGFAEGLGKQVIWTCREDCLKNLSFDTRQFRHVVWREPQMLRANLCATVKALMPSV